MLETVVINKLRELGIEHACIGGYPRNLKLGITPKDFDIAIWGDKAIEAKATLIREFGEELQETYEQPYLAYLIRIKGVDIICYACSTEQEVFSNVDYNINQYKLVGTSPIFMGVNEYRLEEVRGVYGGSSARISHIKALAKLWKDNS